MCWYKRTKKWVVQTKVNGKRVHVGYFDDEEKAAEAYRNAVAGIQRALEVNKTASSSSSNKKTEASSLQQPPSIENSETASEETSKGNNTKNHYTSLDANTSSSPVGEDEANSDDISTSGGADTDAKETQFTL